MKQRGKRQKRIKIERMYFPGMGEGFSDGKAFRAQGAYPGEEVEGFLKRYKRGVGELRGVRILEGASYHRKAPCRHFRICGGCLNQHLPLTWQRSYKEQEVLRLFKDAGFQNLPYRGMFGSYKEWHYRNKMEFSFGDAYKGGPLNLGMHQRNMYNNVIDTDDCRLISSDMNRIRTAVTEYFREQKATAYHTLKKEGNLRHLILRESATTGELLVVLVTSSEALHLQGFTDKLLKLSLEGKIVGVLQLINDLPANAVTFQKKKKLFGREYLTEIIAGRTFHISPLSFFQTNTEAAMLLYRRIRNLISADTRTLLDLYSGTGTISQLLSDLKERLIAVEILPEAVEAAKQAALHNKIENIEFRCGDVVDFLDRFKDEDATIVIDPPRGGLHPKVRKALAQASAKEILYVSCNPLTMVKDLQEMTQNYSIEHMELIDMYPQTPHVETIIVLKRT